MDVSREFKEINYKIKLQVRGQALAAEARIYDMDPVEYVEWVLYAQKLDAAWEAARQAKQALSAMEEVGRAYGQMYRALQESVELFARGFQQALSR